jgi:serine/threonine protein phosphatase PrpC
MTGGKVLDIVLTAPVYQNILKVSVGSRFMKVSGCILPGLDPKGHKKVCQDAYHFLALNGTLFCMLFDGHGREGHLVSNFCKEYTEKFILNNYKDFISDPKTTISKVFQECQKGLEESQINCELSGSTGILLYVHENSIHTGCIGDSRAILGTLSDSVFTFTRPNNSYARGYNVDRMLKPIPLTVDQKPDNTEESLRIRNSGGIIEKFKDTYSESGHFRIYLPESGGALCMTRSLGDKQAKKFGVIAEPEYKFFSMYSSHDQYIIIGSDGIWDTVDNIEALNFIEMWRDKCCDYIDSTFPANNKNCTPARLLAEECRYRWLGFVENEGAVIDDISCIVIDFSKVHDSLYGSMTTAENLKKIPKKLKHLED